MIDSKILKYIKLINKRSKEAFKEISISNSKKRNLAILNTSKIIENNQSKILEANKIDIENAQLKKMSAHF
jgi:gamma-glutamyl phosphate reductase